MPILQAEPCCYPDDVLDHPIASGEHRWWCLHTRPRQEKAVARELLKRRVAHYLPQTVHSSMTPGGRRIRAYLPLFPGYLFLCGDPYDRLDALQGGRLVSILDVFDQDELVHDLRQVFRVIESGLQVTHEPRYAPGQKVRITRGPLEGLVGTVLRRGKHDEFVASVRFLGSGATVKLLDWQVEPNYEAQ
jgi:transcriptional antiterminator RfaH